jgi:predicted dehydrogenase
MEAMWTRFLPAAQALRDHVAGGRIGEVRVVTGNFGTSQLPEADNSMFDAALGGGAMAHLAPYPLSLAQWLFGVPEVVQALGTIGPTGVDEDVAIQLRYPGGTLGVFHVSLRSWAPDDFQLLGSEGMLAVRGSVVRPHGLELWREAPLAKQPQDHGWKARLRQHGLVHRLAQRLDRSSRGRSVRERHPYAGNGYGHEAAAVRACIARGETECPTMPLDESIAVAETIDAVRAAIGLPVSGGVA